MATQEVDWREPPPPKNGQKGIWEERLAPLVQNPGRWAMIHEAESLEAAQSAVNNLRRRRVRIPHSDHNWDFVGREREVFGVYRGRGKDARVRRAKRTR